MHQTAIQPPPQAKKVQHFLSLNWYNSFIEFVFKFVAMTSELLLAAGLIVSAADFLTDGSVMQANSILSATWAWTQAIAIESSGGVVVVFALQSFRSNDKAKGMAYALLGALLAIVAGIMLYIQLVAHSLNLPEARAITHVGVNPQLMAVLRAITCIGYVVLARTKHIHFSGNQRQETGNQFQQALPLDLEALSAHLLPHLTPALTSALHTHFETVILPHLYPKSTPAEPTPELSATSVATKAQQQTEGTEGTGSPEQSPASITTMYSEADSEKLAAAYQQLHAEGGRITTERLSKKASLRKAKAVAWLRDHGTPEEQENAA